jgi:AraC family transcriptional regulator
MDQPDVRIVTIPPLRVARFHAYGEGPEMLAWEKLTAWAEPRGLLDYSEAHQIFGFNNPNPAPGSPAYGYEYWITVTPEETADISGDPSDDTSVEIITFPGGRYAVTRCVVQNPEADIPATWQKLVAWREQSAYGPGDHQWLERHIYVNRPGEVFDLDLYLPIAE